MKQISIIIFIFIINGCCKNNTPTPANILSGKIRKLTVFQSDSINNYNDTIAFNFDYDYTTGFCKSIISSNGYYALYLYKINDVFFKIKQIQGNNIFNLDLYLNTDRRITKINSIDTITQEEKLLINFSYKQNNTLDSISTYRPTGYPFAVDLSNYEYIYIYMNYEKSTIHWFNFFNGNNEYTKVISNTYTNHENNKNIPIQIPFYEPGFDDKYLTYLGFGNINFTLYFLSLNDIKGLEMNNNLVSQRNTTSYSYVFNSNNIVTDMVVSDDINSLVQKIKLEYY